MHPDRNYGNVEETTKHFADVQSAYEILSDPQERAWYDTHRDVILRGGDDLSGDRYENDVRVTTAKDIMQMMTRFHSKPDFSDSSAGFFGGLRRTFEDLANEEAVACEREGLAPTTYPTFGHKNDTHEDVVKLFYAEWSSFATRKAFSWEDIYRYSEAPDRRVRRLMERENKRLREDGIREFNDAVRSLVAFAKKRDPRFRPNPQTESERQKVLKDAASAQAARSRAANQVRNAQVQSIPEWMNPSEAAEESEAGESEDITREHFECVVCKKDFKSEKQYEAHEKSKKHVKAVQEIRRKMQREDQILNMGEAAQKKETSFVTPMIDVQNTHAKSEEEGGRSASNDILAEEDHTESGTMPGRDTKDHGAKVEEVFQPSLDLESASLSSDDEYAAREDVESCILDHCPHDIGSQGATNLQENSQTSVDDLSSRLTSKSLDHVSSDSLPKAGKAKEKRAKKAAQQSSLNVGHDMGFKCTSCQVGFPSKTKLFNHIKVFGHAQAVPFFPRGGKGNQRR